MSAKDDRALSRFLRTELLERLAHELRGPIGVTLGALDELELELEHADRARMDAMLAIARRGARRALRTVEHLSRSAELERGTMELASDPVDLGPLVYEAAREAATLEPRKQITSHVARVEGGHTISGDAAWLSLALTELLVRAAHAARTKVDVSLRAEREVLLLTISDDRKSAPEHLHPRFSLEAGRGESGLGAALIHDVLARQSASIDVEQSSEHGACTRVRFAVL